jgi:hypothetical protein
VEVFSLTFETTRNAPEGTRADVEALHEFIANNLGHPRDDILVMAHDSGEITCRIGPSVGAFVPKSSQLDDDDPDGSSGGMNANQVDNESSARDSAVSTG